MVFLKRTVTAFLVLALFAMTGCSSVVTSPAYGAPGLGSQDIFPCAAFRPTTPALDEISWDSTAGGFQKNTISVNYLQGQFSGPVMSGIQRGGWFMDAQGYGYFSHVTLANFIEVYQSTAGAYILGTWGLWAADNSQLWENIDFSGSNDYIFGLAYDSVGPILYSMWLDVNTLPMIFLTAADALTIDVTHYSCTRFGDSLYGPLHYIWEGNLGQLYNFFSPPSAGVLRSPYLLNAILQPSGLWASCQIVGDFEERLWAFTLDPLIPFVNCQMAFSSLTDTVFEHVEILPFPLPHEHAWKCATRYTDNTIHSVAIYTVPDGPDWDYQLWYTRRSQWGGLTPVMIDNWSVIALVKHLQDARLSVQITTSPSGVMLWTIQYDAVLGIGDVYAYFLDTEFYHDPTTGPWITYPDADESDYDYVELNAPTWWRA